MRGRQIARGVGIAILATGAVVLAVAFAALSAAGTVWFGSLVLDLVGVKP